jgi:hypothetical protein
MTANPSLKQSIGGGGTYRQLYAQYWRGTTFIANANYLFTGAHAYSDRHGSIGTVTISIRLTDANHKPTGADLAVGSADASGWSTSLANNYVAVQNAYPLTSGTEYIIIWRLSGGDASNYLEMTFGGSSSYKKDESSDYGVTWSESDNGYNMGVWGCSPPIISTATGAVKSSTSLDFQGTIDYMGDYTPIHACFEYGLDTGYGTITSEVDKTVAGAFNQVITGLTKGTTYHFRAVGRYT